MGNYIDLVLCETCNGKKELFQAPAFSHFKNGEMVIVETESGDGMTNVVSSLCLRFDEQEECDFIKAALNVSGSFDELDRIKSRVVFRKFEYEEEEEQKA